MLRFHRLCWIRTTPSSMVAIRQPRTSSPTDTLTVFLALRSYSSAKNWPCPAMTPTNVSCTGGALGGGGLTTTGLGRGLLATGRGGRRVCEKSGRSTIARNRPRLSSASGLRLTPAALAVSVGLVVVSGLAFSAGREGEACALAMVVGCAASAKWRSNDIPGGIVVPPSSCRRGPSCQANMASPMANVVRIAKRIEITARSQ